MSQKVALDWDTRQIRMVVGESAGRQTRITHAAIVPIGDDGPVPALQRLVAEHGLSKCEAVVAVGRDQAELRQMQFPPVPADELPDMVRFQAIRTFASAGENAVVDYLPTETVAASGASESSGSIAAIVSASGPSKLDPVRRIVQESGLTLSRLALRPVAAAALFQVAGLQSAKHQSRLSELTRSTLALIDLVGDEAELVLFRGRDVAFVRGVRLPATGDLRVNTLAGEIRRSLIASGGGAGPCNVAMWGTASRHEQELQQLAEKMGDGQPTMPQRELIDPLDLVSVDPSVRDSVGETVGRLAPLVGLLVADQNHADRLIDFENPRRPAEKKSNRGRLALMIGVPAAAVLAMIFGIYSQFASLDDQIAQAEATNAQLRADVKKADASIARTDQIDRFLDSDVNWLGELDRLSQSIAPADQLILSQVSAVSDMRSGGGRVTIAGAVTSPQVIDQMESDLRDDRHGVIGDGASQIDTKDAYRWRIRETVSVNADAVREDRYRQIENAAESPDPPPNTDSADSDSSSVNTRPADAQEVPA
ncbi:MAG: hypothetical protein AAGJ40_14875 [Planctomycetota bacterium]